MTRPSVTLAMIVKNEEENLPRLFKSIEGCFDEIIITDTGSTDGTVDLAKRLGARVQSFRWVDDFAAARNASFETVKTDYVAWLDADDELETKEGFIRFRDDLMGLADYWLAPYHYSSDAQGRANCSFARERVFRVDRGMKWRYFLHEGVVPQSNYGPVKLQMVNCWAVRHKRTANDLLKDRSRNLSIFHKKMSEGVSLDARMRYYYGKELFEAGNPKEAILAFSQALKDPKLELHDRILGMQYLCFAFLQTDETLKALEIASQGVLLAPSRAEFHCLIGDCYLKLGRFIDAVPHLSAARSCIAQDSGKSPIFSNPESYTVYPTNQLARVYAKLGDLDRGEAEAKSAFDKFGHPESKLIYDDILKAKNTITGYSRAKKTNEIVISCIPNSPYEWDADIAKKRAMGGSETAAIEMAHWLHKLSGRPVKVFNMRTEEKTIDGVHYLNAQNIHAYMAENEPWIHIMWRHAFKLTNAPSFLWCHDLFTPGAENTGAYDKIMCLTPFHKRFVQAMQNIPDEKIYVTRNGLDPLKFDGLSAIEKKPYQFVYGSSPDRGLDRTMRVLDKVREKYPEVTLKIHYGWEHLDNYPQVSGGGSGKDLRLKLEKMVSERKDWVFYHGATEQKELMRSYASSAYCVQPSDFVETSMLTSIELLSCGVYPIMRKLGGVTDTLDFAVKNNMATLVDSDCITESEYALYIDATIKAMDSKAYERVKFDPSSVSWMNVAKEWLRDLPEFSAEAVRNGN